MPTKTERTENWRGGFGDQNGALTLHDDPRGLRVKVWENLDENVPLIQITLKTWELHKLAEIARKRADELLRTE